MERYVCIHGHYYQPPRENPWLEVVELQDSAHPYHDWNERITTECYGPNAVARILDGAGRIRRLVNNYASISFNFGPTLLAWLQDQAPDVYRLILQADQESQERFGGHGSALAQVYNHVILPLANRADKETQVRWGIRDFEGRFGRRPEGMWLAETAVDLETLEVLAQEGIRFTILSPYQAARVRRIDEEPADETTPDEWTDVSGGRIDPKMAYLQNLPSGRSIALFFYDGPISRAVTFEGVLRKGEDLARRLMSAFTDQKGPQLVHIATDGESYGHHAVHGDMALAYALHFIESNKLARLINYGEFLEKFPPEWEVQIVENTSWSCAHGVERWRSDCGCNSGRPGWKQAWRGPLRAALDFLRDALAPLYQEATGALFRDPWQARDGYIDVILDRSAESWKHFLDRHARKALTDAEQLTARKLLEMQRQTQLMYTSCGWFFDEISGLETTQVLAYAGRALHLAEKVLGVRLEEEFLKKLEKVPSNLPEHATGRAVYEKLIRPMRVDWHRITAHYAVSSLFESYPEKVRLFCYEADRGDSHHHEAGKVRLVLGRVQITSTITAEVQRFTYGAVHFGDHNVNGGVGSFKDDSAYKEMVADFGQAFARVDVPTLVRLMDRHFGESNYSLESLFRDEQRRVLKRVLQTNLTEVVAAFGLIYEQHLPTMRFLQHIHAPLPRPYQLTADLLFNTDLRLGFGDDDPNLEYIRKLVQDAAQWGVQLPGGELGYRFAKMLRRYAERWRETPEQLELLHRLAEGVELAQTMPFEVDLWAPQNAWFEVGKRLLPHEEEQAQAGSQAARDWLADFLRLGKLLRVSIDEAKKKLEQLLKAPTLATLADQAWGQGRLPRAAYRLQLSSAFPFASAAALVPYLRDLGISDCSVSPVFEARSGSRHGSDVTDHRHFNPELGGSEDFEALARALREQDLGLLVDVVPNHVGIGDQANAWWLDVLENGPAARHAGYFDIDWAPVNPDLRAKVLLPILGGLYGKELEAGRLKLSFAQGRFWLSYYQHRLPVAPRTTSGILELCLENLLGRMGEVRPEVHELRSILTALNYLPPRKDLTLEQRDERYREKESIRRRLAHLMTGSAELRAALERTLAICNGTPGQPASFDRLDALINAQAYRPAFRRVAAEEINYRRYSDSNELAAIRTELPEVFEASHALVMRLLIDGPATGLRIDHPDGLRDPSGYFRSLQRAYFLGRLRKSLSVSLPDDLLAGQFDRLWGQMVCGREGEAPAELAFFGSAGASPSRGASLSRSSTARWPLYVVAEKVPSQEEPLPDEWALAGTTGYDFLAAVNALFVASENVSAFDRIYQEWTGEQETFRAIVSQAKRCLMEVTMTSEINSLAHRLDRITERNRHYRDFTLNNLRFAIRETIAALEVHRTYVTDSGTVSRRDRRCIDAAVAEAGRRNPGMADDVLDFLRDLLLLNNLEAFAEPDRELIRDWVLRFQQITGPVMAKGVEDTVFYRYHRFVTLSEAGGQPDQFGLSVEEFHAQNQARQEQLPASLLSTSTHDTKRSEDVRARLNALSELPGEWESALERWREWNKPNLGSADGQPAPSANDQYLLYQTLVGAWPPEPLAEREYKCFRQRVLDYMQKAAREAKVHTSWANPNEAYDSAVRAFVERLLPLAGSGGASTSAPAETLFVNDLRAFQQRLAYFGYFNSLSQLTLKLTCPGVPDIYQGCELWDFSLVDPDNRRPVDYERRQEVLKELREQIDLASLPRQGGEGPKASLLQEGGEGQLVPLVRKLLDRLPDGSIKLYVLHRLLSVRRQQPDLFLSGRYVPLAVEGAAGGVTAFYRFWGEEALLVAVPNRIVHILQGQEKLPVGEVWGQSRLGVAPVPAGTYRNVFTGAEIEIEVSTGVAGLSLAVLCRDFPVAVLVRQK